MSLFVILQKYAQVCNAVWLDELTDETEYPK